MNTNSGNVIIQIEPGADRYTVVYEYGTTGHYVTSSESKFYLYTNTFFWSMLGWGLKPIYGLTFNFAQNSYYITQVNDYIRPYTAVTYDAVADRFEWTMHTTVTRNGMQVHESFQTTYFNAGSAGYTGLMQEYGHLISSTQG